MPNMASKRGGHGATAGDQRGAYGRYHEPCNTRGGRWSNHSGIIRRLGHCVGLSLDTTWAFTILFTEKKGVSVAHNGQIFLLIPWHFQRNRSL